MEKIKYEEIKMEVIFFEDLDVIVTSGDIDQGDNDGEVIA